MNNLPVISRPVTATDHLESAIACWQSEIQELTAQGIRDGSIVVSRTGGKYEQFHWCNGSKRTYVSKQKRDIWQAEINRGRVVLALRRKIEQTQAMMEAEV